VVEEYIAMLNTLSQKQEQLWITRPSISCTEAQLSDHSTFNPLFLVMLPKIDSAGTDSQNHFN